MKKLTLFFIFALILSLFWISCENETSPLKTQDQVETLKKAVTNQVVLPVDADLESAILFIYPTHVNSKTVNVHRITADWEETVVTFNNFGASYNSDIITSFTPDMVEDYIEIDITSVVESWLNGEYQNYGILLDQEETTSVQNYSQYNSREKDVNQPYVMLNYTQNTETHNVKVDLSADAYIWSIVPNDTTGSKNRFYTGYVARGGDLGEKQSLLKFDVTQDREIKCETAFGYGGGWAHCFSEYGFKRWGWTNGPLEEGEYTFDIYAGAGQCDLEKGTLVGELEVNFEESEVEITYSLDEGFSLDEVHIYAGSDEIPAGKNGKLTVAPGQYTIVDDHPDGNPTYTIDVISDEIYIIAHAVVCGYNFNGDFKNDDNGGNDYNYRGNKDDNDHEWDKGKKRGHSKRFWHKFKLFKHK